MMRSVSMSGPGTGTQVPVMEVNWVRDIKEKIGKLIQGEHFAGVGDFSGQSSSGHHGWAHQ